MAARVYGLMTEIVWRERTKERAEPKGYVLFQDDKLAGGAVVSSAPEQSGPHMGSAFPAESNEGNLVPFVTGEWDTESTGPMPSPEDLLLYLVRSGGLYTEAEWAYKYESDASDQYRGMNDLRWMHTPHTPFGDTATSGGSVASVFSTVHNRLIIGYCAVGSNNLIYRYRSIANTDPTDWSATQTHTLSGDKAASSGGTSCMWELPDGTLRWAYTYAKVTGTTEDIDILGSTDGGITWTLVKEGVVTELFGSDQNIGRFIIACSGDWMRLEMWNLSVSTPGLVSAYSADRGATWRLVTGHDDGDGLDDTGGNSDSYYRYETFGLSGANDSGTFIRFRTLNSSSLLRAEICSRDGAWSQILATNSGFFKNDTDIVSTSVARGGGRIWVLIFRSDHHDGSPSGADYWSASSLIIPEPLLTAGWTSLTDPSVEDWSSWGAVDWLKYAGGARIHPKQSVLTWAGDRLLFFTMGIDRQTGTTISELQVPNARYLGGPSRRTLRLPQATNTDFNDELWVQSWESAIGSAGTASPKLSSYSPWAAQRIGLGETITWNPGYQRHEIPVGTLYEVNEQKVINIGWGDNALMLFKTRAQPSTIPSASLPTALTLPANVLQPMWGASISGQSYLTAVMTYACSVHLAGDGGFAVYDASALATLYEGAAGTLAGITTGSFYEFRVALAHSSILGLTGASRIMAEVAWAKEGEYEWSSTGLLTMSDVEPIPGSLSRVDFGNNNQGGSSTFTVDWKEFALASPEQSSSHNLGICLGNIQFSNPGTLRGWAATPQPVRIAHGHDVSWGGAGGFAGDTFTAPVRFEYGWEQVFGDSPASRWRSTTSTTQVATLDATLITPETNDRFIHSGVAGIGTNSRYLWVEYSSDSSFTNPATFYLDALRYSASVTDTADPAHIAVSGDWKDGELAGYYIRAEPGSVTNPGILRIEKNAGGWLHLAGMTSGGTLASYGLTGSPTVKIWGPRLLSGFDEWPAGVRVLTAGGTVDDAFPRYMRVTVPGADVQGEPPEGYWMLGRLQAGLTLPIEVPLSWESEQDFDQPNVTLQTFLSGTRTAYKQGEAKRTLTGISSGDVSRWRDSFRFSLRALSKYSQSPVVLCQDDLRQNDSLFTRFIDGTEFSNQGWKYDSDNSRWHPVGDLSLTFEEEV
tara:strand:+ start:914 stop:4357 length:3444 start_codon:yes stop_codon:yes gene_type:complete